MIYKPKRTWQRLQKSTRNKTKYTDDCQKVLSIVTCIVKGLLEDYQREPEKRESVYTQKINMLANEEDRLILDIKMLRDII